MGAGEIASSASNSFGSGKAAGQTANATMTALGYDQVRRDLARKLHVDPYSSDPVLTKKLNSVAWVMFSARLTVDAAMMAVPARSSFRAWSSPTTWSMRSRRGT
ncbi:MAG: hypothetical protein WB999_04535, partial [Candidatus Binataceae bacterium]